MASRGVLIVAQHPREPFRLPTFLPTPSTTPFPHPPHPLSSRPPFSSPSPPPPPLTPSSILHPPSLPPSPLQQTNLSVLHPLPGHQPPAKPPSDIHRRVSSELIIKCIVVPARALQYVPSIHHFSPPTLPPLSSRDIVPSSSFSSSISLISLACVSFTRADSRAAASSSGLGRCKRWKGTVDKEVSVIEPRSRSNYTYGERDVVDSVHHDFRVERCLDLDMGRNFMGWKLRNEKIRSVICQSIIQNIRIIVILNK